MTIRNLRIEDYEAIYALWSCTPGMGLNAVDDSLEGFSRYVRRNPTTCFVAEEGNGIIGVILAGHDGRRGLIHHAAVAESEQRKGIGEALLHAALAALKREDIHKVLLVVFDQNEKGNAFWEKHGFTKRGDLVYRNRAI